MTITCADCGATQIIPFLPRGASARCHRCNRLLALCSKTGFDLTLACAMAICILLPAAVLMPVMGSTIRRLGFIESRLVSSVPVIYSEVWFPFAFGFLFFAFLFPGFRALFQVIVLGSLRWGWRIWKPGRIFRWSEQLRIWSMTDVVVVAGVVAYFRASAPAGCRGTRRRLGLSRRRRPRARRRSIDGPSCSLECDPSRQHLGSRPAFRVV